MTRGIKEESNEMVTNLAQSNLPIP